MYPEYTGTDLTVTFGSRTRPRAQAAVYQMVKAKEAAKGYVVTDPDTVPGRRHDRGDKGHGQEVRPEERRRPEETS